MKDMEKIEPGSGNVFRDLGLPNPEEALAKAELARQIHEVIKAKRLTQAQAAKIMGVDQPRVSEIVSGKLSKYTIDRLLRYLLRLGRDIEIRVVKHRRRSRPTSLSVVGISSSQSRSSRPHC